MTDSPAKKPRLTQPVLKGRMSVRDTVESIEDFKATADEIGRDPSDCMREAVRDWTAKTRAIYGLAPYLLGLLAMLVPGFAFAQFTVDDSDLSKRMIIDPLFPELSGAGGTSPFAGAVGAFNSALLIVAGILVAYTLIAGTLSTAHDGEMLGKKWSSIWVPIRTTLGAAAIFPTIGGFSVIQAVVVWLALQGVGIANTAVGAWAINPLAGSEFVPPSEIRQLEQTAAAMFETHVCRASIAQEHAQISANGGAGHLGAVGINVNDWLATKQPLESTSFSGWNLVTPMQFSCGTVLLTKPSAKDFPADSQSDATRNLVNPHEVAKAVFPAHQQALQAMDGRMSALADRFIARTAHGDAGGLTSAELTAEVKSAAQAYADTIAQAAAGEIAKLQSDDFKAALTNDGWVMLGAYFMKISHALDSVKAAVGRTADVRVNRAIPEHFYSTRLLMAEAGQFSEAVVTPGAHTVGGERRSKLWDKVLSLVLEAGRDVDPNGMSGHPVIAAKNTGESMKTWSSAVYAVATVGVGAAGILAGNVAGKGAGSDIAFLGMVELIALPLFSITTMMLLAGILAADVVPMIPFVLWFGVVLAWTILLVEAVIAAPLWAVAHLAPDGDGVVGRGGQGYMLVLSLTLRPVLMVLGFLSAVTLLGVLGEFLNSTFANVFRMNVMQDNGAWGGLWSTIAGVLMYALLMGGMFMALFSLIHKIPDSVLRWIGGGDNMLGQTATPMQGAVEGQSSNMLHTGIAAGAVGNQIGGKMAGMAKEHAANQLRADEQNERQDVAAKGDYDGARSRALDAEERVSDRGASPERSERAAMAQAHVGNAAVNMAARQSPAFGERLAKARVQDEGTGRTAHQDALIASEASTSAGAQPYQRNLAAAQDAFGKAQAHAKAAKEARTADPGTKALLGQGSSRSAVEHAQAQSDALASGAGPHYSSGDDAIAAASKADPSFAEGMASSDPAGFLQERMDQARKRQASMERRLARGDGSAKPMPAADAILQRAQQDGVL